MIPPVSRSIPYYNWFANRDGNYCLATNDGSQLLIFASGELSGPHTPEEEAFVATIHAYEGRIQAYIHDVGSTTRIVELKWRENIGSLNESIRMESREIVYEGNKDGFWIDALLFLNDVLDIHDLNLEYETCPSCKAPSVGLCEVCR